jgi:L-asparaginase
MKIDRPLKLLVVFTGGTIASRMAADAFDVDKSSYHLLDFMLNDRYRITTLEPFQILSENMTPDLLYQLFSEITQAIDNTVFDAILIAHGTDTLAYTAHLADYFLSGLSIPVVLFGAKYPFEHKQSDGGINIRNAMTLIDKVSSGVYVVGRAADGTDYVHAAGRVMQADYLTDDFQSYEGQYFGKIVDDSLEMNPEYRPLKHTATARKRILSAFPLSGSLTEETVLLLDAAVGMSYRTLNIDHPDFRYVLQRAYHSGTSCAVDKSSPYSLLFLQELCDRNHKRLFIAPVDSEKTPYASTKILIEAGITPLYDIPVERAWAGLLLCTWLDLEPEELFDLDT